MLIEEYFVNNAKLRHVCYTLIGKKNSKMYAAIIILFSPLILWFIMVLLRQKNISHSHICDSRWVFWHFTDIYMPISVHDVTSTTNF